MLKQFINASYQPWVLPVTECRAPNALSPPPSPKTDFVPPQTVAIDLATGVISHQHARSFLNHRLRQKSPMPELESKPSHNANDRPTDWATQHRLSSHLQSLLQHIGYQFICIHQYSKIYKTGIHLFVFAISSGSADFQNRNSSSARLRSKSYIRGTTDV